MNEAETKNLPLYSRELHEIHHRAAVRRPVSRKPRQGIGQQPVETVLQGEQNTVAAIVRRRRAGIVLLPVITGQGEPRPFADLVLQTGRVLLPGAAQAQPSVAPRMGAEQFDGAFRCNTQGWVYLSIQGDPYDRGYQHGTLLAFAVEGTEIQIWGVAG